MHDRHRLPMLAWPALLAAILIIAGCASPRHTAPVEDRSASARRGAPTSSTSPTTQQPASRPSTGGDVEASMPRPAPGAENAGKAGFYTVKPGDTLVKIGLEHGQNWREIVRWNGLDNPNLIEVGQVLRVVPPSVDANAAQARGVVTGRVEARPLDARPAQAAGASPGALPTGGPAAGTSVPAAPASDTASTGASSTAVAAGAASPAASGASPSTPPAAKEDDDPQWAWPSGGQVIGSFEEGRSKGLVIGGRAGDPVLAAADGRVVYAGSGLRGYGNLIIVKHNNTYLTAYAHNQALLVREDQPVRRGQRIAEMGATDAERVQLHFEIRRQGKPVDPSKLLPAR